VGPRPPGAGLADGVADVGDLDVGVGVVVAAELEDEGLDVAAQLLLGDARHDLRHPGDTRGHQPGGTARGGLAHPAVTRRAR